MTEESGGFKLEKVGNLTSVAQPTDDREKFWLNGALSTQVVHKIPIKFLYFNIENGRYADKMIQLRSDHHGVDIDPRRPEWRDKISRMLRGEYQGTEGDKEPFQKLRADILAKTQLRPGVVLNDGGVLDGNRRLAVLIDLAATEPNPSRFEYFEAVILPQNVGDEDRWRIEAGLQIGRDEKLAYSPINQLLKIKQGLQIFAKNTRPESEIARTLYGVSEEQVRRDIAKIKLIDEYLAFIGRPQAYNEVSRVLERFEEALNAIEAAGKENWKPARFQQLKLALWATIRDGTMDNWQMREIWRAMGVTGKGKSGKYKNEKALDDFLNLDCTVQELRGALSVKASKSPRADLHSKRAEEFLDRMEAMKAASEPLRLANRAKTNLEALLDALTKGGPSQPENWQQTMTTLRQTLHDLMKLAERCDITLKALQKKSDVRGVRVIRH
jgi:hypothetical protein